MSHRPRAVLVTIALALLAAAPAAEAATLGTYGTIAGATTTGLSGRLNTFSTTPALIYQDTGSGGTTGVLDTNEAVFLDLDGDTVVDQNEPQLSAVGPSATAGTPAAAGISTSILAATNPGTTALTALLRFRDSLPAYAEGGPDGKFNPGEILFLDANQDTLLSAGDLILSGGTPGARQGAADTDNTWNGGGTECVYQGTGSAVAAGMIRVAGCTAGAAGTVVASGNADVGFTLAAISGLLMTTPAASRTVADGVTTASSVTVTSATAAFAVTSCDVGAAISGGSIPGGATIQVINSGTSVDLSAAPTATATGVSLTITPTGTRTLPGGATTISSTTVTTAAPAFCAADVGRTISGTGIPSGATIVAFGSATSVTISSAATATGTGLTLTLGANTAIFQSGQTSYFGTGTTVTSGLHRGAAYGAHSARTVVDCVVAADHAADTDCGVAVTAMTGTLVARTIASYPTFASAATATFATNLIKWLDMNGDGSFGPLDRVYADVDGNSFAGPADVRLSTGSSAVFGSRPALGDLDARAALLATAQDAAVPIFQDTSGDGALQSTEPVALSLDGDEHLDFGDVPVVTVAGCTAGTPRIGATTCGVSSSGTWKKVSSPAMRLCYHDEGTAGATRGDGLYVHLGASCAPAASGDVRITQSIVSGTSYAGGSFVPASGSDVGVTTTAVTLSAAGTHRIRLFDADGSGTVTPLDWPYVESRLASGDNNRAGVSDARLHSQASLAFGGFLSETISTDKDTLIQLTTVGATPTFAFIDLDGSGGRSLSDPMYLLTPGLGAACGVLKATDLHLSAGRSSLPAGTSIAGSSEAGMTCTDISTAKFAFLPTSSPFSASSTLVVDLGGDGAVTVGDIRISTSPGSKIASSDSLINTAVTAIPLSPAAPLGTRTNNVAMMYVDSNGNGVLEAGEPIVLDIDGDTFYSAGDVLLSGTGGTTTLDATATAAAQQSPATAASTAASSATTPATTAPTSSTPTSAAPTTAADGTWNGPTNVVNANKGLLASLKIESTGDGASLSWAQQDGITGYQVWGAASPFTLLATINDAAVTSYTAPAKSSYLVTAFHGAQGNLTAEQVNAGQVPGLQAGVQPVGLVPAKREPIPAPGLLVGLAAVAAALLLQRRRLA